MSKDSDDRRTARVQLWSLREDVLVEDAPGQERLVVITQWGEVVIHPVDETVRESLRRMSLGPVSLENVLTPRRGVRRDGTNLRQVLNQLSGSVVRSLGLSDGEAPLLSAVPVTRHAALHLPRIEARSPIRLSRFTIMRAHGDELMLESPLAEYDVLLHRHLAAQTVAALAGVTSAPEIAELLRLSTDLVADILAYLVGTGVALSGERDPETGRATFAEDSDPTLIRWSHHDLLFHVRSRMGRHGGPSGAVFPYADKLPAPDLVKPLSSGELYYLYRPDITNLIATDPTLTEVLENARRYSELTDRPLTAEQVGELLFRAARIRSVASESTAQVSYAVSDRPYLSVFGLYELELYVTVHNCLGLPKGIYHYNPRAHALALVNDSSSERGELLDGARVAARTSVQPPILISLTVRVERSSWMYGGIGYSLTLAHVGALQQTLCLVANAMGLAACAPAVDPGDATDGALRLDTPAEVAVGEFIVG